jgi:hypothetical protein
VDELKSNLAHLNECKNHHISSQGNTVFSHVSGATEVLVAELLKGRILGSRITDNISKNPDISLKTIRLRKGNSRHFPNWPLLAPGHYIHFRRYVLVFHVMNQIGKISNQLACSISPSYLHEKNAQASCQRKTTQYKKSCGRKKSQNENSQTQSDDSTELLAEAIGRLSVDDNEDEVRIDTDSEKNENKDLMEFEKDPLNSSNQIQRKELLVNTIKRINVNLGISGKDCNFQHPKMCQKHISHGTNFHKGYQKNAKGHTFSLSIKLSANMACEFMHIKGTRRFQSCHVNNTQNSWKMGAKRTTH